jgi:HAD superfamily hydrolase (TIGR01509 family)
MSSELSPGLLAWTPVAVVFDCDGLLVDTEPCWTIAETAIFASRGLDFGPAQKELVIGKSLAAAAEVMAEVFHEPGAGPQIARELLRRVEEVVGAQALAMPGAAELVAVTARRVPVAVASNSPRGLLDASLRRADLSEAFKITIAADEVARAKPAPDTYLAACAALGVPPADCLAFEDSMTGLRSARAAGLRVAGIPTLAHADFPADIVFPSLLDERLLGWIGRW